jgi:hypothetical protein
VIDGVAESMAASSERIVMRPLASRVIGIALPLIALVAALVIVQRASFTATIRLTREAPRVVRPDVQPTFGSYTVEQGRLFDRSASTYSLNEDYSRASVNSVCEIWLREPRARQDSTFETLRAWSFRHPAGVRTDTPISLHHCDPRLFAESDAMVDRLDVWLLRGTSGTFEERVGSPLRGIPLALLVVALTLLLTSPTLLYRVEIEARDTSIRIVRRFGPLRRISEVLKGEISAVRVDARQIGPWTFHRPTIVAGKVRPIELWPFGRLELDRAIKARDEIANLLERTGPRNAEGARPYR